MRKNYIYIAILLFAAPGVNAQDFHLSHYDMATQYINPALTGMYFGEKNDYKFSADYRSQWMSSSIQPYSTAYLGFDMGNSRSMPNLGVGGYLINNNAGMGSYNTFNFLLSGAYNVMGNSNGKHYLTTGVQVGVLYKAFDPGNFTYDSQYSEASGTFDSSLPNQENFTRTSVTGLDANYGIFYKYSETIAKAHPFAGFSIYHVTRPNESFTSEIHKTPMRFNVHGGCDVKVDETVKVTPRFLYMNQASATELMVGMIAYDKFKNTPYTVILQCDYRNKDAVVVGMGLKYNEHMFRISYDVVTSPLKSYLGGGGSWEFSLILTGKKSRLPGFMN